MLFVEFFGSCLAARPDRTLRSQVALSSLVLHQSATVFSPGLSNSSLKLHGQPGLYLVT